MNQKQKLSVFRAQTVNVKELITTWKHLKRTIHVGLIKADSDSVRVHTKLLALSYCAWTEALFSKIIHTPHGFTLSEIKQISSERQGNGITAAWECAVKLALRRVPSGPQGHLANIKRTLNKLVNEYVEAPSLIRNKLAHGQFQIALNRKNTDQNKDLTVEITQLDVIKLDRLIIAFQGLADIIEAIIESPIKGALRDYWGLSQKIETNLKRMEKHTLKQKINLLRKKNQLKNKKK